MRGRVRVKGREERVGKEKGIIRRGMGMDEAEKVDMYVCINACIHTCIHANTYSMQTQSQIDIESNQASIWWPDLCFCP